MNENWEIENLRISKEQRFFPRYIWRRYCYNINNLDIFLIFFTFRLIVENNLDENYTPIFYII